MNEEKIIYVTQEDGTKKEGMIMFSVESNGDTFVFYELEDMVYSSKIDEDNNLYPVDEDEWEIIEKIYNQWIESQEEE